MMWRWAMMSAGLLCSFSLSAAEIRRCEQGRGQVAYVSGDCPVGSREAWVRQVQPDKDAVTRQRQAVDRWEQATRNEVAARLRSTTMASARVGRGARRTTNAERCEDARQHRAKVRDRDWLRITFDQMRALDAAVAEACR